MTSDHAAPFPEETPTVRRILAIDEEIAALDRVQPKSRYLWYGTALLVAFLVWAVTLVAAGSSSSEVLLRVVLSVTVPSVIFGVQLAHNRRQRHRLELELDEIVEAPASTDTRPRLRAGGQDASGPALTVVFALAATLAVPLVAQSPTPSPADQPYDLATSTGTIYGSLRLPPTAAGPVPVALLIAGSGPTDRDGNSAMLPGPNNSLKLLAEGLAARGIATVRFDKRGIAASSAAGPSEADLRFEVYVEDAAAWVAKLQADARFSSVTVVGHSEGSLIGMIASGRPGADAFVSVAGPARRASDLLRDQLRPTLPAALATENERILVRLEAAETADAVPAALGPLYRASVQPYLISWFRYTPSVEIAKLKIPVLIVQGTTDIQVARPEADALARAKPDARVAIVEGMNHVFKEVPADLARQQAAYSDPSLPVAPALVEAIATFVRALPGR